MFFRPFSNDWSTYPPNLPYSGKPMVNEPGLLFLEVPIADSWNLDPKEHCIIFPSLQSFQHPKLLVSGIYVPIGSSFAIHLKCHSLWVNVVPEPLLSGDSLRSRRWQLPCLLPPGPQRPVTKTSTKGKMERLHFGHSDIDWFFFDLEITSNQPNDDDIFRRTGILWNWTIIFPCALHQPKRKNHKPRPTENHVGSHGFYRFFMFVQKWFTCLDNESSVIHRTLRINECLSKKGWLEKNSRLTEMW